MNSNDPLASRRQVVGGMTTGLAVATIAGPALAQDGEAAVAPGPLENPLTRYPAPPFPKQTQEPPGLAKEMTPRPDHGETSYKGSKRLAGRKALITGGDSGIGRAAAIAYAREGADVAISYLPAEAPDAKDVVELIRAEGCQAVALPGDIQDEAFCQKLVEDAVEQLGGLDILVNNAAKQVSVDSLLDVTTEQFDAMAKQLAPKGIRVNAVAPGPVWTPLQPSGGQPPDKLASFGADTPMGRPGQPAELAGIYVLLASPESSYSTGQVFGAAGGAGGP
jgi:NAD(P)-dependent dehydrogenase (short-subunit alcohol dehydrogenase family)